MAPGAALHPWRRWLPYIPGAGGRWSGAPGSKSPEVQGSGGVGPVARCLLCVWYLFLCLLRLNIICWVLFCFHYFYFCSGKKTQSFIGPATTAPAAAHLRWRLRLPVAPAAAAPVRRPPRRRAAARARPAARAKPGAPTAGDAGAESAPPRGSRQAGRPGLPAGSP